MPYFSYNFIIACKDNDLSPLLKKLKENINSEIENIFLSEVHISKENRSILNSENKISLMKLKIVLLRKINKLLENNEDLNEDSQKELTKLNKTLEDIDHEISQKPSESIILPSAQKSSVQISPISKQNTQISQSPLFAANKTMKFEFGEVSLNSTLEFSKEDLKSAILEENKEKEKEKLIEEIKINLTEKSMDNSIDSITEQTVKNLKIIPKSPKNNIKTNANLQKDLSKIESCKAVKTASFTNNTPKIAKNLNNHIEKSRSKSSQPSLRNTLKNVPMKKVKMVNKQINITQNNKENISMNIEQEKNVKGTKLCEPELKIAVDNEKLKNKIEAGMKKTPLSHIGSMLNKIKMGEI